MCGFARLQGSGWEGWLTYRRAKELGGQVRGGPRPLKDMNHVVASHAVIERNFDRLLGEIVDDREHLQAPSCA